MANRRSGIWTLLWLLSTAVVLVATLWPLSDFQDHAHWGRISWVPLADPAANTLEMVANVLLFVPFAYTGVRALGGGRRAMWLALAIAGLVSLSVEGAQVFAHGRFPSTTDLLTNLTGAVVGARLGRRRDAGDAVRKG